MNRLNMLANVKRLGVRACSYSVAPHWATTCDCKYGIESDPSPNERYYCGEQTGCPELRDIHSILKAMTDDEFTTICDRMTEQMAELWRQYQKEHPEVAEMSNPDASTLRDHLQIEYGTDWGLSDTRLQSAADAARKQLSWLVIAGGELQAEMWGSRP